MNAKRLCVVAAVCALGILGCAHGKHWPEDEASRSQGVSQCDDAAGDCEPDVSVDEGAGGTGGGTGTGTTTTGGRPSGCGA